MYLFRKQGVLIHYGTVCYVHEIDKNSGVFRFAWRQVQVAEIQITLNNAHSNILKEYAVLIFKPAIVDLRKSTVCDSKAHSAVSIGLTLKMGI